MAQFRAWIKGMRGLASRLGSKASGLVAHIHGWNTGVAVRGYHDTKKDKDVFIVTRTQGTNGPSAHHPVAKIVEGEPTEITHIPNIREEI